MKKLKKLQQQVTASPCHDTRPSLRGTTSQGRLLSPSLAQRLFLFLTILVMGANGAWADAVSATQTILNDGQTSTWTNISATVAKNASLGGNGLYFDAKNSVSTSGSVVNTKNGAIMYVKVPAATSAGTIQIIGSVDAADRKVYLGSDESTTISMHRTDVSNKTSFTSSHVVKINNGYYIKVNSISDFKFTQVSVTLTSTAYAITYGNGWYSKSTGRHALASGKTMRITFHNVGCVGNTTDSKEDQQWFNWILAAGTDSERDHTYAGLRADGHDIVNTSATTSRITDASGNGANMSTFTTDMKNGGDVDLYVSNSGNKLYVNATTVANGNTYFFTSQINNSTTTAYISLMGEYCTLSDITFYDPVDAYSITANTGANGTEQSLVNRNGMNISSGIYVQSGEEIIYTSRANDGYEFDNWNVTGTTGTPSVDGENDIYTVYSIQAGTSITANYKAKAAAGTKTVSDLVVIPDSYNASNVYSFVPTEALVTGTLYSDNHILGFGGNSYQNGMGVTVKGSGRYIAIKVNSGAHIQVTGYRNGSSSDRKLYIGTTAGGSQLAESPIFATGETRTLNATATANNQVIYISANSQDMYVKQITVFYGDVVAPTYSIATGTTVSLSDPITITSATDGSTIYGVWENVANTHGAEYIRNYSHESGASPLTVYPNQGGTWYLHTVAEKCGVLSAVSDALYTVRAAYTVTFNSNGGQLRLGDDDEVDYGNSLTEPSVGAGITLPTASKAGVTFLGWGTAADATTPDAGLAGANYKPSADCTLYAVFTPVGGEWSQSFTRSDDKENVFSIGQTATINGVVMQPLTDGTNEFDKRFVGQVQNGHWKFYKGGVANMDGGDRRFGITSCNKGQIVTINSTCALNTPYNAILIETNGNNRIYRVLNTGSISFAIPKNSDNQIVSISVSNPANYVITTTAEHGTIILKDEDNNTIDGTSVPEYSTVKITTEPSATYKLESITVKKTSDATDITSSVYKNSVLTMPSYDVTITASFTQGCPSVGQDGYHDVSTNGTVGTGSNAFLKNFSQFFTLEKNKNYYFNFVNKGNSNNTGSFQNWFMYAVSSQVHPGDGAWKAANHEMLVLRADGVVWGNNRNESSRTLKRIAENGEETIITIPSGNGGLTSPDKETFIADMVNADVHVGVTFTGTQLKVKAKMVSTTGNTYILEETTTSFAALDQIYMFFGTEASQITGLTDREVNFAEERYERDLIDVEWTAGIPTIAGATYTCSNQKVAKVNETTGALKFINTGLTSVKATIEDVISDTYTLIVKAEDATDDLRYIQNAGAGYTTRYTVTGAGKLVNKAVNATNISMTYGTSNHIAIVRELNSTLGASVIDNNGELNASLTAGKPTAGTFYTFKPSLPGTLQIKGYFRNNGSHAAQLFLDDDMSVKATIAYKRDGLATSDIITLQGGKTYYLYVDPNAANSGDYFCLTSFEYTSNLKFDKLSHTITKVNGTTQYQYTQTIKGATAGNTVTYSAQVVKDNESALSASVDNSGNVTITSSEDKDGGAVIVTATIDGTASISYVINVPYIGKHTWYFAKDVIRKEEGLADKSSSKTSSLWNLTYEFRHTSDDDVSLHAAGQHGPGCLNVGVVSLQAKVEQDNAKYIGETNGLLIDADYGRLGLGANLSAGHDTYADRSNATIADVVGVNRVDLCSGTKMTIPQVKSGWYVKVYWRPHAGKGSGSCIKAENLTDLAGVEIVDPFKVYGLTEMRNATGPYYRGCTVFRVKRDAQNENKDVSFTIQNAPWGWNQIAKIEISDEFSSEMRLGMHNGSNYVPTETPRGNYSFVSRNNGDLTINYIGQPGYVYGENAAHLDYECQFDGTLTNDPSIETYTDGKGYPCLKIYTHGGFGNIRVIQNVHYESTLNSGTKYLLNRKETEIAVGNITVQPYPYTWDFTGYNVDAAKGSTVLSEITTNAEIASNNEYGAWAAGNKTAVRSSIDVKTIGSNVGGHDYYLGTIDESYNDNKKSIEKPLFADGSELTVGDQIIKETIGLGITAGIVGQYKTGTNNTVIEDYHKQLSFDGGCMKSTRGYSITIPNVTKDMYVLVRASAAVTASNAAVSNKFAPYWNTDATISVFQASTTGDVVLTIPAGTEIYKIGVTDQVKEVAWYGYTTESRAIDIDHAETKSFSANMSAFYVTGTEGHNEYQIESAGTTNCAPIGTGVYVPAGNGIVLKDDGYQSTEHTKGVKYYIPLFVPACNIATIQADLTGNLLEATTSATQSSKVINGTKVNDANQYYTMSNYYVRVDGNNNELGGGVHNEVNEPCFFRYIGGSTSVSNKAYLFFENASQAKTLDRFFLDFGDWKDVCDVDGDGFVNIDDVTKVINVICGSETITVGDVNGDGRIDIDDVTKVINRICGQE